MTLSTKALLAPPERRDGLAGDVRNGLTAMPKSLPPKWFYDARGSELFDAITRLPEYYPTRTERGILRGHAADIAAAAHPEVLIELGSGTSEKTRILIEAFLSGGTLRRFVPVDVDRTVLENAGAEIAKTYPGLAVQAVVADFEEHLDQLPGYGRRLVAFLGSTIGNLEPGQRSRFLLQLTGLLRPGDSVLLGTDLIKDPERLAAAYDDSAGVTAEFNLNVLAVINRELGGDFDLSAFRHVAIWDERHAWMEMRLRSVRDQHVRIGGIDLQVDFAAGEEVRTEISTKFTPTGIAAELAAAGMTVTQQWTDPAADFCVTLAVPAAIHQDRGGASTPG